MDYQISYQEIIKKMEHGLRPQIRLSSQDFEELAAHIKRLLAQEFNQENYQEIKKILCILGATQNFSPLFDDHLTQLLIRVHNPPSSSLRPSQQSSLIIFTLVSLNHHLVARKLRDGEKIPAQLMKELRKLLSHSDPEVLEWTLRIIEEVGGQAIILKEDLLKIKPGLSSIFNKHKKAAKLMIEQLEKKWTPPQR